MANARTLQVCGTGSGVGKSVIVSALCRIFLQDGYRVCPFKAQNMALNSFVTKEQGEIGRAQAVQAAACRIEPNVDMNPILLKPSTDIKAQVIIRGRALDTMSARNYINHKSSFQGVVRESFERLNNAYEIVVIEGAGSPAEINLKSHDIVNMKMAQYARAPVILVGDIDKGGVFAWLIGTLELLDKEERRIIKGFIINKFRGDKTLLKPGIDFLEKRTAIKVLGVIPYFSAFDKNGKGIFIPEEDSLPLNAFREKKARQQMLNIDVIYLPHISNFTDFDALEKEPDVNLRYIKSPEELNSPDVIIIPGTKNTIKDLDWLRRCGLASRILSKPSVMLMGICGGYQMLGDKIYDLEKLESQKTQIEGLKVLPMVTHLEREKILSQVMAQELSSKLIVSGYEIHHGRSKNLKKLKPLFRILKRQGKEAEDFDGVVSEDARVWGTYIHGIFEADIFRRDFLNRLRLKKGWPALAQMTTFDLDKEFDKLARLVRENIDMDFLYKILKR